MQIPSCRFHCADSLAQILSYGDSIDRSCADSISQIRPADFIVQILLCGFLHAPSIVSIERIPSSALQHSIVRMRVFLSCPSCGFHGTGSIV